MTLKRQQIARGLHQLYLPLYVGLCERLPDSWQPVEGLRTFEEQAERYAQGRTTPGKIVTRASPGKSWHNYGLATDWDWHEQGKYKPLEFNDPHWQEYLDVCKELGLECLDWERPHNQYPSDVSVGKLFDAYNNGGMAAVTELLIGG